MSLTYFCNFLNVSEDHQTSLLCKLHVNQTLPQMQNFIHLVKSTRYGGKKASNTCVWGQIKEYQMNLNS